MNSEESSSAEPVVANAGQVADPRPLAVAAQVLLAVYTVLELGVGLAGGSRWSLYPVFSAVSPLYVIGTPVVFLCWFRRCRTNAEVLAPGTHEYSTWFAVGGWFLPFAMWWVPRRMALDIWRASGPADGEWLINAWWAAWLAMTVGGAIVGLAGPRPDGFSLYSQIAGVVAGVLAIMVVRQITARQSADVRAGLATASG